MYIKTSTRVFACIHNYDSWHTRVSLIRCSEMKWKQTPITTYSKTVYKVQRYRFNSVVIMLVTLINSVVTINALGGVSAFYIYVHPYSPIQHNKPWKFERNVFLKSASFFCKQLPPPPSSISGNLQSIFS